MNLAAWVPLYMDLFIGRHDDYAVQLSSGRYWRRGKPLTERDVLAHLQGVHTYGTYVLDPESRCRFAVSDDDTPAGLHRLSLLQAALYDDGIASYLEASRRGGHLWVFLATPTPASVVRAWLLPYLAKDMELYPKQEVSRGYGSLIRLPLGIHRRTGKRYGFVERWGERFFPLAHTLEEMLMLLATFKRVEPPMVTTSMSKPAPAHQSFSSPSIHTSSSRTPLTIRQWNAMQDPFQVIGRYVDLSPAGFGCCPFGEHHKHGADRHPSFKVYRPGVPGGYSWYCYTWQQGGSVFDFLRYYHGVDARTLWYRLNNQEGA